MFFLNGRPDVDDGLTDIRFVRRNDPYEDTAWPLYLKRMAALPVILTKDKASRSWLTGIYRAKLLGVLTGVQLPLCALSLSLNRPWSLLGFVPWLACTLVIGKIWLAYRRHSLPILSMAETDEGAGLLSLGQTFLAQASLRAESATETAWREILAEGQKISSVQQECLSRFT